MTENELQRFHLVEKLTCEAGHQARHHSHHYRHDHHDHHDHNHCEAQITWVPILWAQGQLRRAWNEGLICGEHLYHALNRYNWIIKKAKGNSPTDMNIYC